MIKTLTAKIDGRWMANGVEIADAILDGRQIDDIANFLQPTIDDLIPLDRLKNIDKAYDIITETVEKDGKFLVYFDIDNDGTCAGAIVARYLSKMGANVQTYIGEGKIHGLNNLPIEELYGIDTLIIVDSIDDNVGLYTKILDLGVKICCFDHHIIPQSLIDAKLDIVLVSCMDDYPNTSLSGSAVAWKVMSYIDEMNWTDYATDLVDLAATGLVGDMMDLSVPENRYICYEGFNNLRNPALKKIVGSYMFNAESVSYSVSPLINGCMRTNNNYIARQMFMSDDEDEISWLMASAKKFKEKQNKMVDEVINDLRIQGDSQKDKKCKVFWIPEEYKNLSGLLGNKLLSEYQSPLLVVREHLDGTISGSMRAVGVDDFALVVNNTGLAICSGHELAAGFECKKENWETFLCVIEDTLKDIEFCTNIEADIELSPDQIDDGLIRHINSLNRISGNGFKPITVLIRSDDYTVGCMSKGKHLKITDNKSGMIFVKWNDGSYESVPENGEIIGIGTISNAYYGRTKYKQCVMNDYVVNTTE